MGTGPKTPVWGQAPSHVSMGTGPKTPVWGQAPSHECSTWHTCLTSPHTSWRSSSIKASMSTASHAARSAARSLAVGGGGDHGDDPDKSMLTNVSTSGPRNCASLVTTCIGPGGIIPTASTTLVNSTYEPELKTSSTRPRAGAPSGVSKCCAAAPWCVATNGCPRRLTPDGCRGRATTRQRSPSGHRPHPLRPGQNRRRHARCRC